MISLEVKNISIKYKLARRNLKSIFCFNKTKDFYALKDISFQAEAGEVIGIIGQNGSGKSTLLKAVANIFTPDSGSIDLHGNGVGLLALGTGFDNNLSGYENIYLSGMLLGFSKQYITDIIDDIIEFSELEEFIDNPVKTYSSGMYSKLAFSIAIHLRRSILLIDEVLSVGDIRFKEKSSKAIFKIMEDKDTTVLIVSHDMSSLKDLCNKIIWLDNGKIVKIGKPDQILNEYQKFMNTDNKKKD